MASANDRPIVLAITGASGVPYGLRLLQQLLAAGRHVHLIMSHAGAAVVTQETGIKVDLENGDLDELLNTQLEYLGDACISDGVSIDSQLSYEHCSDFMSPTASGSYLTDGMVICPCSGGTLSAVVTGASRNLIHRAAEVHLKEKRNLVLVTRETPLSLVHIRNMELAVQAGAVVLPASPGFYHGADSVGDLVDFVVARILDQLAVENDLSQRWGC
ncbi:MAG: UbiX family flavin prenyltransferase [Pirellulaceae bacterium]